MVMLKRIDEPYNSPTFSLEALLAMAEEEKPKHSMGLSVLVRQITESEEV